MDLILPFGFNWTIFSVIFCVANIIILSINDDDDDEDDGNVSALNKSFSFAVVANVGGMMTPISSCCSLIYGMVDCGGNICGFSSIILSSSIYEERKKNKWWIMGKILYWSNGFFNIENCHHCAGQLIIESIIILFIMQKK